MCTNLQAKQTTVTFWTQICSKMDFGVGINTSNIPSASIFNQNGQLLIFRPKFAKITQLRAIFWFKYCWGCCRELGGDWNELGGGGWSWVEVDGAAWSWVHGLVILIAFIHFDTNWFFSCDIEVSLVIIWFYMMVSPNIDPSGTPYVIWV